MKKLLASAAGVVAFTVACTIDVADFTGKTCETASDCPDTHVCVAVRQGQGRTCEVLGLPGIPDAGEVDAGPVPTYCDDVQPILAASCVSTCHGADTSGSNQTSFRLDYYAPPDGGGADGGGLPGAFAKAARIRARTSVFQDMPPSPTTVTLPTAEQRAIVARWVEGGAPFCDAGTGEPDGGAADGGRADGGVDAGP
ncbi:hypothetical protein FJV41_15650 [Myxococcus llanfairpwllgwyngyllgogerychwyrndrobwllllantysiliogogogochensis]|uniref:Lipoprotein n=1 Tax=Myxococcus llanfairpwllgwyngyllgogerychwyrndrobwllllantysiliogogogochensis TaxID=2590453 RepID=A0A540X192_9BACT|nr:MULTISPECIES: hypothetical protein [Myxococcus]NTX14861.1 hypothetical protein [Myxococcus sp. CA056]NTX52620.1 hypothetical protein [Myxococcus sp. CA039A]TQF15016.1 hypothetical protein FJV41_15650 [Myxococcus llanfairpwllgwyngyllgogerychwyrndrobwllllantysiliogogogochensis]